MKNRRKTISIEEKLDVINRLEKDEGNVDISRNVRLADIIAHTVRSKAERIKEMPSQQLKLRLSQSYQSVNK